MSNTKCVSKTKLDSKDEYVIGFGKKKVNNITTTTQQPKSVIASVYPANLNNNIIITSNNRSPHFLHTADAAVVLSAAAASNKLAAEKNLNTTSQISSELSASSSSCTSTCDEETTALSQQEQRKVSNRFLIQQQTSDIMEKATSKLKSDKSDGGSKKRVSVKESTPLYKVTCSQPRSAAAAEIIHTDSLVATTKMQINSHSYKNAYQQAFAIEPDDPRRDTLFFRLNAPIHVQIVGHEEEPSLVLLHTNFYIINIEHCGYQWTVKRRYKNFLKLYEAFTLFKTRQNIKDLAVSAHLTSATATATAATTSTNGGADDQSAQIEVATNAAAAAAAAVAEGTAAHNTEAATSFENGLLQTHESLNQQSNFKPSDHFKLLFQSIGSDFNQARSILEKFLKDVVEHKVFRNHNETLKFLEVSHLSFISELGDKNKEGLIKKPTFTLDCCCLFNYSFFWDSHWLIVKDTWIGCLDHKTGRVKTVILVDQGFRVLHGVENTGVRHGLLIENGASAKSLLVKCYNEKRAMEWRLAILQMCFSTGERFFNVQRHGSFAPVREHQHHSSSSACTKWFVDGSDYMESVADAIESAREEVFITGFFLTPELYLKRPVIMGDKWRLDKLLQRKAEQGVRVYILLYKEIEMTLSINSAYSKRVLAMAHKNIKVLRHPDHINEPNKLHTIMWAHHEKLVVVDQSVAFFGGLDLCYGRWDNHLHKLTDLGSVLPSNHSNSTMITSPAQQPLQQQNHKAMVTSSLETIDSLLPNEEPPHHNLILNQASLIKQQHQQQQQANPVRLISFHRLNSVVTNNEAAAATTSTAAESAVADSGALSPITNHNGVKISSSSSSSSRQIRTMRMLSSPSCSIETTESGGGVGVSGGGINVPPVLKETCKITAESYSDDDDDQDHESSKLMMIADYQLSTIKNKVKFDLENNNTQVNNLKRSKSLDISSINSGAAAAARVNNHLYASNSNNINNNNNNNNETQCVPPSMPTVNSDSVFNNKLRLLKETFVKNYNNNNRQKTAENNVNLSASQSLRLFRDYGEMSILNKLKKIKQFKDNLKKYKLRIQQHDADTGSELNSSFEVEHMQVVAKSSSSSIDDTAAIQLINNNQTIAANANANANADNNKPMTTAAVMDKSFVLSECELLAHNLQGSSKYWVGKDYCNFIMKDVRDVHVPFKDCIDRQQVPRLPWHDVAGLVCGAAARDIARHFIQRWNYVRGKKVAASNANYTLLAPKSYQAEYLVPAHLSETNNTATAADSAAAVDKCNVQVLRSVGNWSVGVTRTESSIHEAMRHLINTSKHYVYIENQFFVSMCFQQQPMTTATAAADIAVGLNGGDQSINGAANSSYSQQPLVHNQIANCLYERIVRAHRDKESFKVYVVMPLIPGYEGEYGKSSGVLLHAITHYNNSSFAMLFKKLAEASIDPLNYMCVFSLRTWSELSGRLVTELVYVHSKLMIVDDRACLIGSANVNDRSLLGHRDSELAVLVEDTEFVPGVLGGDRRARVGKFASSLRHRLFKEFLGEFPGGTAASCCSLNMSSSSSSSSSSNNSTTMTITPSRQQNTAAAAAAPIDISDPCSDEFYKQVWLRYAAQNTKIYDVVFKSIPCDLVSNFQQLKEYQKMSCLSQTNPTEAKNELSKIKGYLVLYPTRFLCHEDLTPPLGSKEKLLPSSLFT